MKKNGPSHTVGHESSKQQGRYSLERSQCVCADAKRVSANDKKKPMSLDTSDVVRGVGSGRIHSQPGVHCSFVPTGHTIDEGSHPSISRRFSARSRMIVVEFLPGAELQEVLES